MCFLAEESVDASVDDIDDDIPLKFVSLAHELFGCEFSKLVELEQNIPTGINPPKNS